MKASSLFYTVLALTTLLSGTTACVTVDGDGEDGSGGSSGKVCINGACDEVDDDDDGSAPPDNEGECPNVAELTSIPKSSGGPSFCASYEPGECDVLQDGCSVQLSCDYYGTMTLAIDHDGVTDDFDVPIGDGVVATCHAELDEPNAWLVLVCTAQGMTCEFTAWE